MEELAPVTLIVKAPNQKIEDKRVACDKSWTVRQLKEHLSTVYPEKPRGDQQKLVYYGKLLKDDSHLHEVLTHDTYEDAHTVHLVCPQHASSKPSGSRPTLPKFAPADSVTEPQTSQNTENLGEGLRNRFTPYYSTHGLLPQQPQQPPYPISSIDISQLTAQQKLWLQAYQQQWWLYQAQLQQMAMLNQTTQAQNNNGPVTEQPNAAPPAAEPVRQAAGNDEAVQMNAQGGVEADMGQRDWLDRIYSLFRFTMIVSLFYFYTTVGRFFTVCFIALFFYLAQGNIRVQRRQINRGAAGAAPPEENQAENQNNENAERSSPTTDNPDSTSPQPQVVNQQQQTSSILLFFRSLFSFIFSFFASLVPQQLDIPAN